jgi:sodium/potassium-transporting ATPase subunit alpha
MSKSSS